MRTIKCRLCAFTGTWAQLKRHFGTEHSNSLPYIDEIAEGDQDLWSRLYRSEEIHAAKFLDASVARQDRELIDDLMSGYFAGANDDK